MSIVIPPELNWLVLLTAGSDWPKGDEDELRELARVWDGLADQVHTVVGRLDSHTQGVLAAMHGEPAEQFAGFVGKLRSNLPQIAQGAAETGAMAFNQAAEVEYAKWMIISQMIMTAAEIAYAIAMAPFTFGASMAWIPAAKAIATAVVRQILRRLLQHVAIEVISQLALDAAIQGIQMLKGDRTQWNTQATAGAALGGAVSGLTGGLVHGGMGRALGNDIDTGWGRTLTNTLAGGASGLTSTVASNGVFGDDSSLGWGAASGAFGGAVSGHGRGHGNGSTVHGPDDLHLDPIDAPELGGTRSGPGTAGTGDLLGGSRGGDGLPASGLPGLDGGPGPSGVATAAHTPAAAPRRGGAAQPVAASSSSAPPRPQTGTVGIASPARPHVAEGGGHTATVTPAGGVFRHPGDPGQHASTDTAVRYVAVVPMRTGDTPAHTAAAIQQLVDHYEQAARTGGRAGVSLVVGINRADAQTGAGGTAGHVDDHLRALPGTIRSSIPVTVVGAGWTSHTTDRPGVPFGAIRQQLANHPEVARQAHESGADRTYLHLGDGDVRSMLTPDGRGLLVQAGDTLGRDDAPRLLSGGYRLEDAHGGTTLESAQDAAVRQVFARADPTLNYFPEPNTFYRVDTGPGEQTLSPGHDFGAFDQEGQHLVDTVRRTDGDHALAWDGGLSIATDPTRVNQNGNVDPQSHATANGWSSRVGPWLRHQLGVTVDGERLNQLAGIATDPGRPIAGAQGLLRGIHDDLVAQGRTDARATTSRIGTLVRDTRNAIDGAGAHRDAHAPGPVPPPRSAPPVAGAGRPVAGPQWHEGPTAPARAAEQPTPSAAFEHRRDGAPVATVHTESFRVQRGPDGGLEHHGPLLRSEVVGTQHEVRRIQADDGSWVHEATIPVHLAGDPQVVADVRTRAQAAVDGLNGRYHLPNGDQLHVRLEDRPAGEGVPTVQVHGGEGRSDQRTWFAGEPDTIFVHESLHALGLHDGYRGGAVLGGQVDTVGIMGDAAAHGGPVHLTDANLQRIQDVVDATAVVRDHPLAPHGPATIPTHAPAAAPSRGRPAQQDVELDRLDAPPVPPKDAPPVPPKDGAPVPVPVGHDDGPARPQVPDQRRVTSVDDVAAVHAEVRAALGLRDDQQLTGHAALDDALTHRPATLHGEGRRFTVLVDGRPREVRVAVEAAGDVVPGAPTGRREHVSGGVDRPRGTASTGDAAPEMRGAVTAGAVVGPSATIGGSVSLAHPTLGRAEAITTLRDTRLAVLDTAAPQPGHARVAVGTEGGTRPPVPVPAHVETPPPGGDAPTRPGGPVVGSLELAAPDGPARVGRTADGRGAFDALAGDLHPAITRDGAPGRGVLDTVTSAAGITERMPELLGGRWVDAPDLVAADGHRVAGIRMRLVDPRLTPYDTRPDGALETEARGTSDNPVVTTTRTGGDGSVGLGGGTTLPPVGGAAQLTVSGGAHHGAEVRTSTPVATRRRADFKGTVEGHLLAGILEVQVPGHDAHRVPVEQVLRMSPWQAERALGGHGGPAGDRRPPRFLELGHGIGSGRVLGPGNAFGTGGAGVRRGVDVADHVGQRLRALGLDGLAPTDSDVRPGADRRGPAGRRDVPGATDRSGTVAADRDLRAAFSPERLAHEFDAMLGDGYRTTFVERGWFRTRRVEVTVRAHLGDLVDGGPVPGATLTSTRAAEDRHGVVHSADRSAGVGLDGRVNLPVYTGDQRVMPAPNAGVRYTRTAAETSSGDAAAARTTQLGGRGARAFHGTATYEVEVTTHSRVRRWVRRTTPGLPGTTDPAWWPWRSRTDTTSAGHERITVLTADAATRPARAEAGPDDGSVPPPTVRPLPVPRTLEQVLTGPPVDPDGARPTPRLLEVEAFGGGRTLADAARDALREASGGDEAVVGRGTPAAERISSTFGPQRLAGPGVLDRGTTLPGLRHGRRVADRVGEVGMRLDLDRPVLASEPTTLLTREGVSGTARATGTTRITDAVEASAGLVVGVNGTQHLGGAIPSSGPGPLAADSTRVSHGRSRHEARGGAVTGTAERSADTPARDAVLVRFDAVAEVVAESRNRGTVHDAFRGDGVGRAAREVRLPGAVHAWVAREEAVRLGLLPGRPDPARDAGPAAVPPGLAGDRVDLGSGVVTSEHDLRPLVGDLRDRLRAGGHGDLLPSSMLEDRMQTLHRAVALTGDHSVRGLLEQASRDGVAMEVPRPRTFGRDDDRLVLRARPVGPAQVVDVVHDGTGTHVKATGTVTATDGSGRDATTGVAAAVTPQHRWGGSEPDRYGQVGGGVGASVSDRHGTTSTDTTTTEDVTQTTTSGPMAVVERRHGFSLEYRRGDRVLATTDPREQTVTVRLPADDVTTGRTGPAGAAPGPVAAPFPFVGDHEDAALARWRAAGPAVPPATAVLATPEGGDELLTHALREAGAGSSLTGPGAPARAAIAQVTSPEARAATLGRLLREGLPVPGLVPTGAVGGQHATATLHDRLDRLRWGAPSEGTEMRGSASRVAGTTTAVTDKVSGAVDVRPLEGGGGTFRPDASLQATGEVRRPAEGGDTRTATTVPGHEGSSRARERTWTVVADLELVAVASVRDRIGMPGRDRSTATWQTRAPGAVTLRMTESDARALLGEPPADLVRRQEEQSARAADWRTAETERRAVLAEREREPAAESSEDLLDEQRDLSVRRNATGEPLTDEFRELGERIDRARAAERRDAGFAARIDAAERRVARARQAWWDAKVARDAALDRHHAPPEPVADRAPVLPMPEFGVIDRPADLRDDPAPVLPAPDVGDPFDMDAILNPGPVARPAD